MTLEPQRLGRLVELGRTLVSELDLEALLHRVLDVARELTGARYAALGILDDSGAGLERFVTSGIDDAGRAAIGELPAGRGVLGVLIQDPRPLRLRDVGEHESSFGFPPAHPPMSSFLGVPIRVRGEVFGNLYLTEKDDGPFTEEDEEALVVLADWAAIGIANAGRHREVRGHRDELERAVRGFEAATDLARAVGGETEPELVLELIVKRARALLDARTAVLYDVVGEEVIPRAAAGRRREVALARRTRMGRGVTGSALTSGRSDPGNIPQASLAGDLGATAVAFSSLRFRGEPLGVIAVYGDEPFTAEDERLLADFAASAASAMATAQNAASRALRLSINAAESERKRWARELHDQTLQELGALRMLLTAARRAEPEDMVEAVDYAVSLIKDAVAELRHLITDLRPAALDQLGVQAALEALADRLRKQFGIDVDLAVDLDYESGRCAERPGADLESTLYRIAQEALTNVVRHSGATRASVGVRQSEGRVVVEVADDGKGFSTDGTERGFGLVGMQERAALAGGTVRVESAAGRGTRVVAELPVPRSAAPERAAPGGARAGATRARLAPMGPE
jgi:signal transduction histidine kinase